MLRSEEHLLESFDAVWSAASALDEEVKSRMDTARH